MFILCVQMHDIAVVTLDVPVTFVPPVRLGFGLYVNSGLAAGVVGWGYSGLLLYAIQN
jgi:hypothetical protein